MSNPKVLWLCSWFPNDEDQFRGDFIMRQAEALSTILPIEIFHFVAHANKSDLQVYTINNTSRVTIGYDVTKNNILSFRKQWRFYNQCLQEYTRRHGKPDIVHVHIPWKVGLVARYWLKKYNIPYIISEHYGIYNTHVADSIFTKPKLVMYLNEKIFQSAASVITVSKSLGEEIKTLFGVDYQLVPNVVNTDNFYFSNITKKNTFSFLHISNMYAIKNTDKIITAFASAHQQDSSIRLYLAGAMPKAILDQIKALPCKEAIEIIDEVTYKDVSELMKAHHCFVLFSDWETQSCVTLEALCSGRPVISSAVGGVQELIQPQNGILVEAGNITTLSTAMLAIKQHYHQYHLEQIAADAQAKYAYQEVAALLLKSYQSLMSS